MINNEILKDYSAEINSVNQLWIGNVCIRLPEDKLERDMVLFSLILQCAQGLSDIVTNPADEEDESTSALICLARHAACVVSEQAGGTWHDFDGEHWSSDEMERICNE